MFFGFYLPLSLYKLYVVCFHLSSGNQPVPLSAERCTQNSSIPQRLFNQGNLLVSAFCYSFSGMPLTRGQVYFSSQDPLIVVDKPS